MNHKPFKDLYKDEKDKYIEKSLYHSHRLIENLNKLKREYEKDINSTIVVDPKL